VGRILNETPETPPPAATPNRTQNKETEPKTSCDRRAPQTLTQRQQQREKNIRTAEAGTAGHHQGTPGHHQQKSEQQALGHHQQSLRIRLLNTTSLALHYNTSEDLRKQQPNKIRTPPAKSENQAPGHHQLCTALHINRVRTPPAKSENQAPGAQHRNSHGTTEARNSSTSSNLQSTPELNHRGYPHIRLIFDLKNPSISFLPHLPPKGKQDPSLGLLLP
jgi:hypothetical protein